MLKKISWIGVAIVAVGGSIAALAQSAQTANPIAQQLVGRWEGQSNPSAGAFEAPLGVKFSSTGKAIFMMRVTLRDHVAFVMNYSINHKPKPMHLDLQTENPTKTINDGKPALTIFELPNPHTLRLQVKDLNSERPTQFKDEVQYSKVSDSAIVSPEPAQLDKAERSNAGEGRLVMQTLALSALYHILEAKQLPTTLNQLGLSNDVTQNYRYQLQAKSNQLMLMARPNKGNLKSYIAVVLRLPNQPIDSSLTAVCESVHPSTIAPPMPKISIPASGKDTVQCGSGSAALEF
ncbi:MAG TPA: type IV pilin-like G/H family protein [Leptolyngbya sp.]|jgi:hypothetical protein|nr:type IV pilin-like G/H family protein [Leptolyngbya sp.]